MIRSGDLVGIRLRRLLYLTSVAAFFLPFATVRSCAGDKSASYTGFELLGEEAGVLLVGVLSLALVLFALSFRRRVFATHRRGLASAAKALLCALAILATELSTGFPFLFSQVSVQVGFYLCVGSWLALYALSLRVSIRHLTLARDECRERPPPWGLPVALAIVVADLITIWVSEPTELWEGVLGVLASLLVGAPIVLVVMLLAVRYRIARAR